MKIFNSLTNNIEEFKPIEENKVKMYVCGPTVYNFSHIGNMRPVVFFDTVQRYLKYLGYEVEIASNFTDVSPEITKVALENNITEREVANRFTKAFLENVEDLNCLPADHRPTVLNNISEIVEFIKILIKEEYAYENDGDVYFRVSKIDDYGKLSNQKKEELEAGSRVEIDDKKDNPLDFVLWRKTKKGEQFDSPWGKGIPGWHTECVVMMENIFERKIDIHGGGIDLIFPHHENERAQAKAILKHDLSKYWMHNGYINIDNEKMGKSIGNYLWAKDLIKDFGGNVIRIFLLRTHYRQPLNISDAVLEDAKTVNEKIFNTLKQASLRLQIDNIDLSEEVEIKEFELAMEEDFNTPNAFTYLLKLLKEINIVLREEGEIAELTKKIIKVTNLLGLKYDLKKLTTEEKELYKKWLYFRTIKDFEEADKIRQELVKNKIL